MLPFVQTLSMECAELNYAVTLPEWARSCIRGMENVDEPYFVAEDSCTNSFLGLFFPLFLSWFFQGFRRADAEKALSLCGKHGAFLVRNSETSQGEYSISVRDHDAIKHYRIKRSGESGKYYVSRQAHFDDIISLVEFYKRNPDMGGLRLKFPCDKLDTPTPFSLSHRDEWEIDRTSLQFMEKLGAGQFGEVWQAKWNNTTDVAVKMLKPDSMERQAFMQEAQIMKDLQHPKLIRLYAVCTVGEPILIVTELMSNGALLEYLRQYKNELRMPHLVRGTAIRICVVLFNHSDLSVCHANFCPG